MLRPYRYVSATTTLVTIHPEPAAVSCTVTKLALARSGGVTKARKWRLEASEVSPIT